MTHPTIVIHWARTLVLIGGIGLVVVPTSGCGAFGYSNRVLWRVTSPNGQLVVVCQEVPAFDGPGYSVRLERPGGGLVRHLYEIGDGDPCSEVVWSADGQTLAVLSGHVARVRFVDIAWVLSRARRSQADMTILRASGLLTEARSVTGDERRHRTRMQYASNPVHWRSSMYIVVEHTITDPAKFWAVAQQGIPSLPAHLKLHQCFPAPDGNRAVCVWEANSVREVETYFDASGLAEVSRNEFYGVENKEGVALPSSQAA